MGWQKRKYSPLEGLAFLSFCQCSAVLAIRLKSQSQLDTHMLLTLSQTAKGVNSTPSNCAQSYQAGRPQRKVKMGIRLGDLQKFLPVLFFYNSVILLIFNTRLKQYMLATEILKNSQQLNITRLYTTTNNSSPFPDTKNLDWLSEGLA